MADTCKYGHPLTPENTLDSTHRPCRRCTRNASRARQKLGTTLAGYMENEAAYDALFDSRPQAAYLDWSVPQHCQGTCGRELRAQNSPRDDRPALAGRGRCNRCYRAERRNS